MLVCRVRLAEILLNTLLQVWPVCVCVCMCVFMWQTEHSSIGMAGEYLCVMCLCLGFKGFLCVHTFTSSLQGGNHCVLGELACARVYSKVDYVFGSILLTITKSFCFGENSTRKPMCLLSLCRESACFTPIAKWRKGVFCGAGKHHK